VIDPSETLAAQLGITGDWHNGALTKVALEPYPELLNRGIMRISVLALVADMMGGLVAHVSSQHDWVFTTDLSVRAPILRAPERLVGSGTPLRVGKSSIHSEVHMVDETGALFAYSQVGFVRVARRYGDNPQPDVESAAERWYDRPRITEPLDVAAGVEIVDAACGAVEVELHDRLRNPAGAMQGAMVALVGEIAAESMATHHLGTPQVVTDLDVRYLAMGRVGPVYSRAWFVGEPAHGTVHVELRDRGNGDRVMTALLARTTSAPGAAVSSG
jgi:acyl-coenzyme A thioesterase PaaI-like protein